MLTSNSVQSRSSPIQPISTASNSLTSSGKYAAPCPTSSYTVKINCKFVFGVTLPALIALIKLTSTATDALSSKNLDLINPDFEQQFSSHKRQCLRFEY